MTRYASGDEAMNRKLTAAECFAKAEVFEECAVHLELAWTDDPLERKAGDRFQSALRVRVERWRKLGRQRMTHNVELRPQPKAVAP